MGPGGHVVVLPVVAGRVVRDPALTTFEAMLDGWRSQQLARGLAFSTISAREQVVRRFQGYCNEWPWVWTMVLADEWFTDLRVHRRVAHSTLRSVQGALRQFCWYVTDPAYGWAAECEARFGTHPVQVVTEANAVAHVQANESRPTKRAFTHAELQDFLDHADEQVLRAQTLGRKGWLAAYRDAVVFKIAYSYGLRRNEVRMLDVTDFGANPHAPGFGAFGVAYVRHGKAMRGAPPKRRSVLTVWDWTSEVLAEWIHEIRPAYRPGPRDRALFPSERGERIGLSGLNRTFARYRRELGLSDGLDMHSLRRSYVTHLIESGFDALFVQQQVGHEHASTTSLYTCVSSDFRTRTLTRALTKTLDQLPSTLEER